MADGGADITRYEAVEGDGDGFVVRAMDGALEKVDVAAGDLVGIGGIGDLLPVQVVDGCAGSRGDIGDGEFPERAVERSVERAGVFVHVEIDEGGGAGPGGCWGKGALWWLGGAKGAGPDHGGMTAGFCGEEEGAGGDVVCACHVAVDWPGEAEKRIFERDYLSGLPIGSVGGSEVVVDDGPKVVGGALGGVALVDDAPGKRAILVYEVAGSKDGGDLWCFRSVGGRAGASS